MAYTPGKYKVTTNEHGLNVRSAPDPSSTRTSWLPKGKEIDVVGTAPGPNGSTWLKLNDGSYVNGKYCTQTSSSTPVASNNTVDANISTNQEKTAVETAFGEKMESILANHNASLQKLASESSTRMFGLPHQLIAHNDSRISSTTNLGRMFTETFILDAPLIYLKPGTTDYLPDLTDDEKSTITEKFTSLAAGVEEKVSAATEIGNLLKDGDIRYFQFKQDYAAYIFQVNLLCRIGAVFLGIQDTKVPWVTNGNVTYGTYDWRHYNFSPTKTPAMMTKTENATKAGAIASFVKNAVVTVGNMIADDKKYVPFYIDASASFSEDASNSTTGSVLTQFTDSLSEAARELQFVSGYSGLDAKGLVEDTSRSMADVVDNVVKGDTAIGKMLHRLTSNTHQLLAGSNFLSPEVWSGSDYSKNYSFSLTLSTPYGNKESWYLNIFVPLMHILAMALPVQTSANTYSSPFLIRAFAPGWFSCDMGFITSIGIDKGGSGDAWTTSGLPNEIKVSITIKDLYSNLSLPDSFRNFFNNDGLINFLMVNCGVNIMKTGLDDKLAVITDIFTNSIKDIVTETVSGVWYNFQDDLRKLISLYK